MMGATVTVSLGIVREQAGAKNLTTRTEDPSQSDISEASIKESIANLAYALWERPGCLVEGCVANSSAKAKRLRILFMAKQRHRR
jgi:hypothetical protein